MKLNDMEESLNLITNSVSRELMYNAFKSYSVDILKGSVIFTYLAVIEHLKQGCLSIKDTLKNETKAKIEDIFESNEYRYTPENNIPEYLGARNVNLINRQQENFLKDLIYKRNQCAHSSEFILTREDARYLYNNAIELFLKYNLVSGKVTIDNFCQFVLDNDNIFFQKNLEQSLNIIKKNINLEFKNSHFLFYRAIIELYKIPSARYNVERIIYVICKNYDSLFDVFSKESLKYITSNENSTAKMVYNILLKINPGKFIKKAEEVDQDNFLRLFPSILDGCFIDNEVGSILDILIKYRDIDTVYLKLIIAKKLEIPKGDDIFEEIYQKLNQMNFNTVDKYLPRWLPIFELLSRVLNNSECYKIYLRLIKNNILLYKENVMRMTDSEDFYKKIRLKAIEFINENKIPDYNDILFSSNSYYSHARKICDPDNSDINLWNEFVLDCDLIRLIYDNDISCSQSKKLDAISNNINQIKNLNIYDEKKAFLLNNINEDEKYSND